MRLQIARRRYFQCQHLYRVEAWSDAENSKEFGPCFTPNGHGHNYAVDVYLEGEPDPTTGMIVNLAEIDATLAKILEPIDGHHLNFEVLEFSKDVPTTENIARYLWRQWQAVTSDWKAQMVQLRLYENDDLWIDLWRD